MDKLCAYVRDIVVNFKLDSCFCVAPIRAGLLCIGYFNIFVSLLFLVGTADDSFTTPLIFVQKKMLEDTYSKPLGIIPYGTEMSFNMLLLAGVYRNDLTLLRVYIYFVFASIVSSVLVYSIVFIAIDLLMQTLIILSLVFQGYVIILVRSLMVEIKAAKAAEKNGHVTLYSVVQMPENGPATSDNIPNEVVSITTEPKATEENQVLNKDAQHQEDIGHEENPHEQEKRHGEKKDEPPSKLETINEQIKKIKF